MRNGVIEEFPQVLVVEAVRVVDDGLLVALSNSSYVVSVVRSDLEAITLAATQSFDVIILSVEAIDDACLELLRSLRARDHVVPVMVYARVAEEGPLDELFGAEADDCIMAPITIPLVRARLRALLQRSASLAGRSTTAGDIALDRRTHSLAGPEARVPLTQREFSLLAVLVSRQRTIVPRAELLHRVWGYEFDPGTSVLDVTVSRLRRKVTQSGSSIAVRSIRGVGFMLEPESGPPDDAL